MPGSGVRVPHNPLTYFVVELEFIDSHVKGARMRLSNSRFLALLLANCTLMTLMLNVPMAEAVLVGTGNCVQTIDSTTGVSVTTSGSNCVLTFTFSGEMRTWTVPAGGLTNVSFTIKGSAGGGSFPDASYGASFSGSISSLSGLDSVYVTVGGIGSGATGGFGGSSGGNGGNNGSRGGGGSTDIRVGSSSFANRVIVAGGGGGSSGISAINRNGANASGATGGSGGNSGTQTTGNCLGTSGSNSINGGAGGKAAPSVVGFESTTCRNAGGGGGGYAGGGGAGNSSNGSNSTGGKGGSGSSYWNASFADINSDCGSGCTFWNNGTSSTNSDYSKYTNSTNGSLVLTFSNLDTTAPTFTSSSDISVAENILTSATAAAIRVSESATVSISSGIDASRFNITRSETNTAIIKFIYSPNFESPADVGGDNVYELTLTATDSSGNAGTQSITITVTDVLDTSTFNSFALAGSVTTVTFRTSVTISANVSISSRVTFRGNGKALPGCISKSTTGSGSSHSVTCNWQPSVRGIVMLSATSTPTAAGISGASSSPIYTAVQRRVGNR